MGVVFEVSLGLICSLVTFIVNSFAEAAKSVLQIISFMFCTLLSNGIMNQSNDELNQFYPSALRWAVKWLSRITLLVLISIMTYVASRTAYNFSHWIPHDFVRSLGVPYSTRLWAEQNADVFLHFFGAFFITLLIFTAKLHKKVTRPLTISLFVSFLCISAELFQLYIGRGFESGDLLLGFLGTFMAYLTIKNKN